MAQIKQNPLITILGPTASGKTGLAVELARILDGEIISADSRQVYTGMDIGTGKDLHEYQEIPYHLIDVVDPSQEYNLFEFASDFARAFTGITSHNKLPFLVGGTGMYLDAVLNRYKLTIAKYDEIARRELENKSERELVQQLKSFDINLHNTTDLADRDRLIRAIEIARADQNQESYLSLPTFSPLTIGISLPRESVKQRITERLKARFEQGMIDEIKKLHDQGLSWEKLHYFGLEYRFVAKYLQGELNYNDMFQKLNSAIHQFSKQQSKWFRNIEKKGQAIHWIEADENLKNNALDLIDSFLISKN